MSGFRDLLPRLLLAVLTGWGAAGCGIDSTGPVPAGAPASGLRGESGGESVRLYFVGRGGVQAVSRTASGLGPQEALDLLERGPDEAERARGLKSEVATGEGRFTARAAEGAVDLSLPRSVAMMQGRMGSLGLAQIVCTVANAEVPGERRATEVDVRVHEPGSDDPWIVRCDAAGNAIPRYT